MGLVGGGEGAFIGPVHRMAAELDGEIELVCGAFSSDPQRSRASGISRYRLPPERCYPDYRSMLEREARRPASERMDLVAIATPNHLHFDVARAALDAGFHVVCDKPLTHRLEDALALRDAVRESGRLFAVTFNYSGYPLVREARALVASGHLGAIRRVACEYFQGWLAGPAERGDNKQAQWRTDPARAGAAGCFGDIGSHAQHLLEFVTGLRVTELCADLSTFVRGRALDDDGNVLLRFDTNATGVLMASQVAVGEENGLRLRVYGERGSLAWSQTEPNSLVLGGLDESLRIRRAGGPGVGDAANVVTRLPAGHPEGYLEAFATIYRSFAADVRAVAEGRPPVLDYPVVDDGVRSMRFLDAVVRSASARGAWTSVDVDPESTR